VLTVCCGVGSACADQRHPVLPCGGRPVRCAVRARAVCAAVRRRTRSRRCGRGSDPQMCADARAACDGPPQLRGAAPRDGAAHGRHCVLAHAPGGPLRCARSCRSCVTGAEGTCADANVYYRTLLVQAHALERNTVRLRLLCVCDRAALTREGWTRAGAHV
jgi:hypothetical protein